MYQILLNAIRETLIMVVPASICTVLFGIPLGIFMANKNIYKFLNLPLQIASQTPYMLIMIICVPLTNWLLNQNVQFTVAMIMPLSITGSLILAKKINEVIYRLNNRWESTTKALGATNNQKLLLILLPESLDEIVKASFDTCTALIGCSAIAGAFGAGGLGQLAIEKSINDPQPIYAALAIILLVAMQQLIAYTGSLIVAQTQVR